MGEFDQLFSLEGKVALITGGSRGIGYGFASALAAHGADLVLVSRSRTELEQSSVNIQKHTQREVKVVVADLSRLDGLTRAHSIAIEAFGHIDILINNAGTNIRSSFLDISPEDFDYILSVNLRTVHFLSQLVAKDMIKRGEGGRIINVASLSINMGLKNASAYASSKGGIFSLTKAMAIELAPYRITVNSIAPGYFRTGMTQHRFRDPNQMKWMLSRIPLGRTGEPEDIGGTAVFLASRASDYVTGANIPVDGGWTAA